MANLAHDVSGMQIAMLESILAEYGIDTKVFPPALIAAAAQGLALVVVQDEVRGFERHTRKRSRRWRASWISSSGVARCRPQAVR